MSCRSPNVPPYLHWDNKQVFSEADFLPEHRLYRITLNGNPIEFPMGTYTSLSCKWSFLIREEDVLTIDDPPIGDSFKYAFIQSLRGYFIKKEKSDGSNLGFHKLTCVFNHAPKECDYSHCEVNIKHEIFSDEDENCLINSFTYTYQVWQSGAALLSRKTSFYKTFAKDYRKDMIKLFCLPEAEK